MKHPRIIGLYPALVWAVGMRLLTHTERPTYIRCIRYKMLCEGLVMLTVPTADGDERCFVATDMPEDEIARAIHGPYARCPLAQMEAVGTA
jgi:hypothetical protein